MSPLPPHHVRVDDILIRDVPSGSYSLPALPGKFHQPHTCLTLLVRTGQLRLEDDQGRQRVIGAGDGLLMAPWQGHALSLSGRLTSIEFPSYRLNACALIPLSHQRMSEEHYYLLTTMMAELLADDASLTFASQRFVANAMSALVALPEPDRRPAVIDAMEPETALRMEIARLIQGRMKEPHLRAEDVTESLGISRAKLYRTLSPYGGFKRCLDAQRLDHVARRLKTPNEDRLSIKAILFRTGFSTTEQFQRLFHRRFGVSARDFRRARVRKPALVGSVSSATPEVAPTAP